ncbi:hypothetical protein J3R83DRAFT_494 [Lanmaoa asiatica]|nr:hypothetical protein J3R83DRAFT_494 [Lanmaoa asiatica]
MPRIRKKTSRRGTTRQREKIKHKVSEYHKKAKKQTRKDKAAGKLVQKKSKKDPGIPNNFPYKDQILAEVAEQRRQVRSHPVCALCGILISLSQAAAEKQRRKEEKRAVVAGHDSNVLEKSPTPEDIDVDEKDGQGFDGITSLRSAFIPKNKDNSNAVKERTPAIPVFPGPSTLREAVQKADVVLHVVDARDPAAGISDALAESSTRQVGDAAEQSRYTVPRESLVQWLVHLRTWYTILPFRASSAFMPSGTAFEPRNKKAKPMPKDDALGVAGLWAYLDDLAQTKNNEELVVAVTGVTNVGKSAVINSILGSDVFPIYDTYTAGSAKGPYTTTSAQEVVAAMPSNGARRVRFIDTPGMQFVRAASLTDGEREVMRARDILLRCRGRIDRLKDPLFGVTHIVAHGDTQDLMLAYGLPAFLQGDVSGFLAGLARVNRLIKKRGVPDHAGAARIVLRDWSTGKLMRYSMPAGTSGGTTEGDAAVLGAVKSRKELRSAVEVKLVKMDAGVSDKRDVEWDVVWEEEESGNEEESGMGSDGDDDEEEEEEEAQPGRGPGRSGSRRTEFGKTKLRAIHHAKNFFILLIVLLVLLVLLPSSPSSSSSSSPMVKPTFFQKVLGRPSQRYSAPVTTHDICHIEDTDGYRGTSEEALQVSRQCIFPLSFSDRHLPLSSTSDARTTSTSPSSPPPRPPSTPPKTLPRPTPPTSAASSDLSLSDLVRSSASLPDHVALNMAHTDRKLTYTDEDWARDVRWLVAPRTDDQKPKSKAPKRHSAPAAQIPASRSTSSLPSRLPASLPHPPPPRPSKSKGIGKAKVSTARSVIGMTALLEVEEDLDPDGSPTYVHDTPVPQKRTVSITHSPDRSFDAYYKPRVSSPLRSSKLTRQRSFSSPPFLLAGDQTPDPSSRTSNPHPFLASNTERAFSPASRPLSTTSHGTASTSKSPYTSPAPNVLDALSAHVSVSDSPDTLPSTGTRGYTSLVLPHAATSPSLALDHGSNRVWKIGKARPTGATVRDSIGVGLGFGDQVDLSRARLAQTTMASVEIIPAEVSSALCGSPKISRQPRPRARITKVIRTLHLALPPYRTPPVYVGGGSVLVQVWGVGLDTTDARLTGIHPPRASSSLAGAPYGTRIPKTSEKDKGRCPPVGYIPGRSFVGRVLEVGWEVGVDVAKRGDWVVGLMSVHKCGALAEFILADRHRVHRVSNPFIHLKYPFTSAPPTEIANDANGDVSRRHGSPPPAVEEECLTVNELALLPLCGVPAYRAVRTFHQITQNMGKSQLPYGNSHNELHPILPPRSDNQDFIAGGGQEDLDTQVQPCESRPRALILRAHDGAGALAAQMLVREGWSVWAHVPVPFMLPGAQSELPDELKDEEEERELDNQRNMLLTLMPLSALFDVSNMALEARSSWSSPSIQFPRSPSSSPSISPSPFSRSTTSTPLSSPYSHGLSSSHLSSPTSSSSHQNAFTTPYSFTSLPLTPYDCEQGSVVSLMSYLGRSCIRLDAILDTIGGREIWDAGRLLLGRPVRDPSRQDIDAQFTTLVGDTPDRVVSTAGDNFRAGVRALRLGGAKDQHPFEDSGYHEAVTSGHGKDKKGEGEAPAGQLLLGERRVRH